MNVTMMNLFSIFIVANIELCVEMIFQELVAYESNFIKKKKWQWKSNLIEAGSSIELLPFFFIYFFFILIFFFAICIGICNFFLCNLPFFIFLYLFLFFFIFFFWYHQIRFLIDYIPYLSLKCQKLAISLPWRKESPKLKLRVDYHNHNKYWFNCWKI